MRRNRMPEIKEGGVNVTPLIDIVMVLIIFFMLVAKIGVTTGADPTIDLPLSRLGTQLETFSNTLTLNVRPGPLREASEPTVTAMVAGSGQQAEEVKVFDRTTNRQPLLELLRKAHETNPEIQVIIRGEREMEYHNLEPVLFACVEARIKNVLFNTRPQEDVVEAQ